ncbi:elongation factor P hydroxylase [Kushneria aurantia]|uniref:Elongation factor P hydroxylase n=1 Tax=Kushneria aurantia TaxID=504092 RepID=A0ABV6G3W8_9GAMM|nr:elongation factor P hydroxylase [Kushneria aurantia]
MSEPLQEEDRRVECLIVLFDMIFADSFNTRLVRGADEPLYLPAGEDRPCHQVIFAHGFFASALHEISHWCIAGVERRRLEDYGYWYRPDGRDEAAQLAFETAEIAPQAIEKALTQACGRTFNVSIDNLDGSAEVDRHAFAARVEARRQGYIEAGFPPRAAALLPALKAVFVEAGSVERAACRARALLDERTASVAR